MLRKFPFFIDGLVTCVDLNVLLLGSYDVLIGMDWLEAHRVKLNYYHETFECMNEEGNPRVVRGIPKVISVRHISSMQLKKFCRKGFELCSAHIVEQSISVLIDPGSTHSYITPRVVEICVFKKVKHRKYWLVQLATRT